MASVVKEIDSFPCQGESARNASAEGASGKIADF